MLRSIDRWFTSLNSLMLEDCCVTYWVWHCGAIVLWNAGIYLEYLTWVRSWSQQQKCMWMICLNRKAVLLIVVFIAVSDCVSVSVYVDSCQNIIFGYDLAGLQRWRKSVCHRSWSKSGQSWVPSYVQYTTLTIITVMLAHSIMIDWCILSAGKLSWLAVIPY